MISVSVRLAAAHPIFRDGLRELLHATNEFEVIADVCNGDYAIGLISNQGVEAAIADELPSRMPNQDMITEISKEKRRGTWCQRSC